jgi:hypothetical protein
MHSFLAWSRLQHCWQPRACPSYFCPEALAALRRQGHLTPAGTPAGMRRIRLPVLSKPRCCIVLGSVPASWKIRFPRTQVSRGICSLPSFRHAEHLGLCAILCGSLWADKRPARCATCSTVMRLSFQLMGALNRTGSSSKAFIPVVPAGIPTGSLTKVYMYSYMSEGEPPHWVDKRATGTCPVYSSAIVAPQVRSLASETARQWHAEHQGLPTLDWYTADFNEGLSAFDGTLMVTPVWQLLPKLCAGLPVCCRRLHAMCASCLSSGW